MSAKDHDETFAVRTADDDGDIFTVTIDDKEYTVTKSDIKGDDTVFFDAKTNTPKEEKKKKKKSSGGNVMPPGSVEIGTIAETEPEEETQNAELEEDEELAR